MSDLVGNLEDRFSGVAAQIDHVSCIVRKPAFGILIPFSVVMHDFDDLYHTLSKASNALVICNHHPPTPQSQGIAGTLTAGQANPC